MKLTKCVNGHFYDEEKFEGCPHCAGGSKLDVNAIFGGAPSAPKPAMSKVERDDDMTVPLEWTPAEAPAAAAPAESSVNVAEKVAEEVAVETSDSAANIQSQPSFDTPLDFDAGFTEGEDTVDEDGPTEEPEEEFELLSKFDSDQTDAEESEVTIEPEPFAMPESEAAAEPEPVQAAEPFVTPEPKPEPFVEPEPEAAAEPFVMPGSEPEPVAAAEPGPFAAPETVQAAWEVSQPNVEEIPTGDSFSTSTVVDHELEDQPTEIVNEVELANGIKETQEPGPFVAPQPSAPIPEAVPAAETPVSSVPSPAAAMFGASTDDDDDEHTVAFYDEIFVSKAPAAPVVPETAPVVDSPAAPIPGMTSAAPTVSVSETTSAASAVPLSASAAGSSGDTAGVPEPEIFTAPPLQPAQALPTPCVGWLIALNGSHIGQDFHLRVGKNYIGRDAGMDIALTGDKSVSRNKHAIVIYEPKHHKYFIQPGESNELVYVNDEVVLLPMPLKAYDVIVIGDIELWFMPLCDDQHNWSEVIRKLQEQM